MKRSVVFCLILTLNLKIEEDRARYKNKNNKVFGARNIAGICVILRAGRPTLSLKTKVEIQEFQIK